MDNNGILSMKEDAYSDWHKILCQIGFEIPPHPNYNHDPMNEGRETWIFYDSGYVSASSDISVHHAYLEGLRHFKRKIEEWIRIMESTVDGGHP